MLLAVLVASLYWVSQPPRVSALLLARIGNALGLQISASGVAEYRLRGTPMLLLRDVVVREPGAPQPLLRASRVYLSLPWSTIRARGGASTIQRVELDRPRLDLAALQHWLATRPPTAATRIPTLTDGLRITGGTVVADGQSRESWRIDGLTLAAPSLYPGRRLQARLRGRYLDAPLAIPFTLAMTLQNPGVLASGGPTGLTSQGKITIQRADWHLPAQLTLSGPVQWRAGALTLAPAHFGMSAQYEAGDTRLPFALGLHGPLKFRQSAWTLAPAGIAIRGDGAIPTADAVGALKLGERLVLELDGTMKRWPDAWPTLPQPIGQSSAPLLFALHYTGATDLSAVTRLRLARGATAFDAIFRLPAARDWLQQPPGSPLPPLDGRLSTPRLVISGAILEGVEVDFDDPAIDTR